MMTNEARVAAVMERGRGQLRKQRRMAGALAAGIVLGSMMAHHEKEVD